MGRLFGTDGVRGIAGLELTTDLSFKLGKAGAWVLSKNKEDERPKIVIGTDTRISKDMLVNALAAGIMSMGANVVNLGVIPTPAVAYITKALHADAGIVVSASHNPYEYNGIKFFNGKGFKLDDSIEEEIEKIVLGEEEEPKEATCQHIGRLLDMSTVSRKMYIDYLVNVMQGESFEGLKVVLDCANGATYQVAEEVFKSLGCETFVIGNKPNGLNINKEIGSTHPEKLAEKVLDVKAHLGLAFDGDGDRLIVVDEKGQVVDGDKIICLCAKLLKEEGKLEKGIVTATVMSNIGFHKYVEDVIGGTVQVTNVGDRYVLESMVKTGGVIGGEQSGHIIFLENSTTGDGILSALEFTKAYLRSGKTVSQMAEEVELYPQVLVNASVANSNKGLFMEDEEVKAVISEAEEVVKDCGRVLIRPSGTEPLVRVMIEGKNQEEIQVLAEKIAKVISEKYK